MGNLYVMVGCPGSGKSTYAKNNFPNALYVSRDEIRFSLISENDEYFSKEDEVFRVFINKINEGLRGPLDVIADATHINKKSRAKLFSHLKIDKEKTKVIIIVMQTSLDLCIKQNENRKGTKYYVPIEVIKRMFYSFEKPSFNEYNNIIDNIRYIKRKE